MAEGFYKNWEEDLKRMREAAPEIGKAFGPFFKGLMGEGALSVREKELVALGIGLALRCEPCIYIHVEKCLKAGATREQILETAGVAVLMQGGPTFTHVPEVVKALDELGA